MGDEYNDERTGWDICGCACKGTSSHAACEDREGHKYGTEHHVRDNLMREWKEWKGLEGVG